MSKRIFRAIEPEWGSNEPLMIIPRVVKVHGEGFGYEYNKVILQPVEVEIVEDKKVSLNVMTQEEKQLLLKDICARLPYKPIVVNAQIDGGYPTKISPHSLKIGMYLDSSKIEDTKIYLRPMSSMTEDEQRTLNSMCDGVEMVSRLSGLKMFDKAFDWLNEHHFDYRGLIEKGLALEAPEGMYNN